MKVIKITKETNDLLEGNHYSKIVALAETKEEARGWLEQFYGSDYRWGNVDACEDKDVFYEKSTFKNESTYFKMEEVEAI